MKFTVVTPLYNMERFIGRTIESVLSQAGDFELEYLVMDGCSTDGGFRIAEQYARRVASGNYPTACKKVTMRAVQQKDTGLYQATNRGFALATGDFYSWLGSDDVYYPGALQAVAAALTAFPDVQWLTAIVDFADEQGRITKKHSSSLYRQDWLRAGVYGIEAYYVPWEGVFFSKDLWKKAGPFPEQYRYASDYWMWMQMAKHAPLWSFNFPTSAFMRRQTQLSNDMSRFRKEQWDARPARPLSAWPPYLYFALRSRLHPFGRSFFEWLYPRLFMSGTEEYIAMEDGVPRKLRARNFICERPA